METIHLFVELLDQYFSNVCEVRFTSFAASMPSALSKRCS
jgi:hypothetical protein